MMMMMMMHCNEMKNWDGGLLKAMNLQHRALRASHRHLRSSPPPFPMLLTRHSQITVMLSALPCSLPSRVCNSAVTIQMNVSHLTEDLAFDIPALTRGEARSGYRISGGVRTFR